MCHQPIQNQSAQEGHQGKETGINQINPVPNLQRRWMQRQGQHQDRDVSHLFMIVDTFHTVSAEALVFHFRSMIEIEISVGDVPTLSAHSPQRATNESLQWV